MIKPEQNIQGNYFQTLIYRQHKIVILERREAHKVSPRIDLTLYRDICQFPSTVKGSVVSAEHCGPAQIQRHGSQLKVGELLESAGQGTKEEKHKESAQNSVKVRRRGREGSPLEFSVKH